MSEGHVARRHAPPSATALCGPARSNRAEAFSDKDLSMNGQEAVLFPVSLSLSISPQEVDASAELTLKAVAECPEDLSGDQISFHDADGREIGSAPLAALEEDGFGAEIIVTAPAEP